MKVGFIGLGAMGLPMACNLIKSGHALSTTFHKRREPADQLAGLGAEVLASPAEVARAADAIITLVPADMQLAETVLGAEGVVHGLSPGKILIDMTTATALTLRRIEAEIAGTGVRILDAPVSGGTAGAEQGTLTIMVGGDAALLEECRPLLETMGENIIHVGPLGQGKVVKMVNQLMAATHLLAIGEAFALGKRCGADPKVLYEVIKASSGYSKMMDLRLPGFLLDGSFEPGFKLDLMKKDIDLGIASAASLGVPLLFGSLASQVFAAASSAGDGEKDFSAAARFLADLAKADLT